MTASKEENYTDALTSGCAQHGGKYVNVGTSAEDVVRLLVQDVNTILKPCQC